MIYGQTVFTKIPKKTIHLDLYVDESKNRHILILMVILKQ